MVFTIAVGGAVGWFATAGADVAAASAFRTAGLLNHLQGKRNPRPSYTGLHLNGSEIIVAAITILVVAAITSIVTYARHRGGAS